MYVVIPALPSKLIIPFDTVSVTGHYPNDQTRGIARSLYYIRWVASPVLPIQPDYMSQISQHIRLWARLQRENDQMEIAINEHFEAEKFTNLVGIGSRILTKGYKRRKGRGQTRILQIETVQWQASRSHLCHRYFSRPPLQYAFWWQINSTYKCRSSSRHSGENWIRRWSKERYCLHEQFRPT